MPLLAAVAKNAARNVLCNSLGLHSLRNGIGHIALVTDPKPCPLSTLVAEGYREAVAELTQEGKRNLVLHNVTFEPDSFLSQIRDRQSSLTLSSSHVDSRREDEELVACILVQRGAFQNQLKAYRLRLRLFELGLRVAEHAHLGAMCASEHEMLAYLKSCTLPPTTAVREGREIAEALDRNASPQRPLIIASRSTYPDKGEEHRLVFNGYLEPCLLNTGYYEGAHDASRNCIASVRRERLSAYQTSSSASPQKTQIPGSVGQCALGVSIGGSFPTGEVISELEDLGALYGEASVFAFPNTSKQMVMAPKPFKVTFEKGCVVDTSRDTPQEFCDLLQLIKDVEGGEVLVRELGIGLNPFVGKDHFVSDVTSFERQCGVHLSLGKRHPLFIKKQHAATTLRPERPSTYIRPPLRRKDGVFHVDIFIDAVWMGIRDKDMFTYKKSFVD